MSTDETDAPDRSRLSDFLLGGAFFSCLWMVAFCLAGVAGFHAISAAPPEPALVFRGADGETITTEDLVDEADPYMRKHIDQLPWGTRYVSHKIARWFMRKHIEVAIAQHGHQVASALKVVEPLSNTLFKPEPAAKIRGIRRLCETPVHEFGPIAESARADAGAVPELGRAAPLGSVGATVEPPHKCLCGVWCDSECSVGCGCERDK